MSLQENRRLQETLVPKGRKDGDSLFSAARAATAVLQAACPPPCGGVGVPANELGCSSALPSLLEVPGAPLKTSGLGLAHTNQMPAPPARRQEVLLIGLALACPCHHGHHEREEVERAWLQCSRKGCLPWPGSAPLPHDSTSSWALPGGAKIAGTRPESALSSAVQSRASGKEM